MAAAQSTRALCQQLLTPFCQLVLIIFQSFLGFIQFPLLFRVLFFKAIESRLQLKENNIYLTATTEYFFNF